MSLDVDWCSDGARGLPADVANAKLGILGDSHGRLIAAALGACFVGVCWCAAKFGVPSLLRR